MSASFDPPGRDQAWIDRVAELGDHHEVGDQAAGDLGLGLRLLAPHQLRNPAVLARREAHHPPQAAVDGVGRLASFRQEPHLVALAHRTTGKLDGFGGVPFEVEPKGAPPGQRLDLAAQVRGQVRVLLLQLPQQVAEPRHVPSPSLTCRGYISGRRSAGPSSTDSGEIPASHQAPAASSPAPVNSCLTLQGDRRTARHAVC